MVTPVDETVRVVLAGFYAGRVARTKKCWSDLNQREQRLIIAGGVAELVLTVVAARDLARRPADQVRGRKLLWLLSFVVQPFGPLAYLTRGRQVA